MNGNKKDVQNHANKTTHGKASEQVSKHNEKQERE